MKIRLGKIAELQPGVYVKTAQNKIPKEAYLLGLKDFDENLTQISRGSRIDLTPVNSKYFIGENDVLFSSRVRFNAMKINYKDEIVNVASNNFIILRPDSKKLLPSYLKWYLNHSKQQALFHFLAQSTGKIPYLQLQKLEKIEINVPDLEKQKEIVKINECLNREFQIMRELILKKNLYIQNTLIKSIENE